MERRGLVPGPPPRSHWAFARLGFAPWDARRDAGKARGSGIRRERSRIDPGDFADAFGIGVSISTSASRSSALGPVDSARRRREGRTTRGRRATTTSTPKISETRTNSNPPRRGRRTPSTSRGATARTVRGGRHPPRCHPPRAPRRFRAARRFPTRGRVSRHPGARVRVDFSFDVSSTIRSPVDFPAASSRMPPRRGRRRRRPFVPSTRARRFSPRAIWRFARRATPPSRRDSPSPSVASRRDARVRRTRAGASPTRASSPPFVRVRRRARRA